MNSLHKRSKKASSKEFIKSPKSGKYANGRWTEKEHYLFLLAVREFGRDWKKIEHVVKTRSSTQARSHAQKVLKQDIPEQLEEEIQKLAKVYGKPEGNERFSINSISTGEDGQGALRGAKGKRKTKSDDKELGEMKENGNIISNVSSVKSEKGSPTSSMSEEFDEDSDYSYCIKPYSKLFAVQRIAKKKTLLGKRKANANNVPLLPNSEFSEVRKDSIVTNTSAWATNAASPLKLMATKRIATPVTQEENIQSQAKDGILNQSDNSSKIKNGCQDDDSFKETERGSLKLPLMGMRRGVSMELPVP